MADIVLYGATGYTGRLTAQALADRGASFAVAGRSATRLEEVARATGTDDVRVVQEGSVASLADALDGARVLVTCVGPFMRFGDVAVEAALKAGVNYVDSTGESPFIARLIARHDEAKRAGIAMAPAMGMDEIPADVAATLATEGMDGADLDLTYAMPRHGSWGTIRSAIPLVSQKGAWLRDGKQTWERPGHEERWAPMPPPLGPRRAISYPLGEGVLAPLHLDLIGCRTYLTTGNAERLGLRFGGPVLGLALRAPGAERLLDRLPGGSGSGPNDEQRRASKWTILAEARAGAQWRNVAVMGTDPYGLTGQTLAAAGAHMAAPDYARVGVLSPVQAVGVENLQKTLIDFGVDVHVYQAE